MKIILAMTTYGFVNYSMFDILVNLIILSSISSDCDCEIASSVLELLSINLASLSNISERYSCPSSVEENQSTTSIASFGDATLAITLSTISLSIDCIKAYLVLIVFIMKPICNTKYILASFDFSNR